MGVRDRLSHAWNAFLNRENEFAADFAGGGYGISYGNRPDRVRLNISNERSIISSIYTRIAIDVGLVNIRHVRLDENKRYISDVDSGLNNCLTVEANIDQAATAFMYDLVMTIFESGTACVVPVDVSLDPSKSASYDIKTLRVGNIVQWYPTKVRVNLYNEQTGRREEVTLDKKFVAIIENPLYAVMNEPNSTLQRLVRKLNLLDTIDEQSSSGKLDIIIQLPYVIKSEARKQQAEQRRQDIEFQLKGSKYGIAYTDGTEKITQLNRPAENNLMTQVEYLVNLLYAQLGLTPAVMDGTATEEAMLNYHNRTIKPLLVAIVESMRRSFLTKTARSQRQDIMFFRDPFLLVPIGQIAEIADKFTRNEILSSNEVRGIVGFKPHNDPKADQLINSNMPQADTGVPVAATEPVVEEEDDNLDAELAALLDEVDGFDEELA